MQRKSQRSGLTALLLSAALLPVTALAQDGNGTEQTQRLNLPSITVVKAQSRDLVDRVVANGTIRAVDEIYIQPQVDGLAIDKLNVDVGDKVEAGAVLAELSKDNLVLQKSQQQANKAKAEAAVSQSKAQLIEAQANLDDAIRQKDRAARLGRSGSGSVSQVEQTEAAAAVAQARLEAARQTVSVGEADIKVVDAQIENIELNLARTGVKAPSAGVITAKNARVGSIASGAATTPLFTLIRDGLVELVADVSETDIQKIKAGQKARVRISGSANAIEGSVRIVSPTVDATTRLGLVHIVLPADSTARAGMYASADIIVSSADALALPLSAVTAGRDGSTTRKVEGDVVRQVAIETGIQDGAFIEVKNGLAVGDMVIEKAGAFVRDGDRINPVTATAPDRASATN